mmetsp:Transcript_105534/g.305083  ORF Transcript_105534/g.305083 Transcript_105534/m.305083 type:complete len:634 (-) Transcript_105534:58-1959(-)
MASESLQDLQTKFKIISSTMQIMSKFSSNFFTISFPESYVAFMGRLNAFASFDFFTLVPSMAYCVYDGRVDLFYFRLFTYTLAPIGLACTLYMVYLVAAFRTDSDTAHIYMSRLCTVLLFLSFVIFVSTSSNLIAALVPDNTLLEITDHCYLRIDYSTRCTPDSAATAAAAIATAASAAAAATTAVESKIIHHHHYCHRHHLLLLPGDTDLYRNFVFPYAIVMIFVYPLGIPFIYFVLLWRHRHEINPTLPDGTRPHDPHSPEMDKVLDMRSANRNLLKCSFLFRSYEPQMWWYEVFECVRRLAMTSLIVLLNPGSTTQIFVGLILALVCVKMFGYYRPYLDDSSDILAELAQWMIVGSLLWIICLKVGDVFPAWLVEGGLIVYNLVIFMAGLLWITYVVLTLIDKYALAEKLPRPFKIVLESCCYCCFKCTRYINKPPEEAPVPAHAEEVTEAGDDTGGKNKSGGGGKRRDESPSRKRSLRKTMSGRHLREVKKEAKHRRQSAKHTSRRRSIRKPRALGSLDAGFSTSSPAMFNVQSESDDEVELEAFEPGDPGTMNVLELRQPKASASLEGIVEEGDKIGSDVGDENVDFHVPRLNVVDPDLSESVFNEVSPRPLEPQINSYHQLTTDNTH